MAYALAFATVLVIFSIIDTLWLGSMADRIYRPLIGEVLADRFRLAHLHQLRGRVGRGEGKSRCLLLRGPELSETARARRGRTGGLQGGVLNKVEQMACLIARRYTEKLTVEEIGRQVGLHPNYAMGLFKKTFGTTLIDYLTHHRVSHAQRLLATTDEKIVEIAFGSGFNSISRFNEAFRRECGCTPRAYRLQHAAKP